MQLERKTEINKKGVRRKFAAVLIALIICFSLNVKSVQAQDVVTGTATATVLTALAVIAAQSLVFGNIYQGVAVTIGNNVNASSGIFNILGQASAGIAISFTLPEYIALANGSDRMTIGFSSTDVTVDSNNTTPAGVVGGDGWVNTNPNNLPAATVIGSAGQTNVYLGGRVYPAVDQTAGAYSGDIILTVAYNGT